MTNRSPRCGGRVFVWGFAGPITRTERRRLSPIAIATRFRAQYHDASGRVGCGPRPFHPRHVERCVMAYNILLMGASYGSLLASKLLFGGHSIHLVCLPAEADLINAEGFKVQLPVR